MKNIKRENNKKKKKWLGVLGGGGKRRYNQCDIMFYYEIKSCK
jgi:hypothetical protein